MFAVVALQFFMEYTFSINKITHTNKKSYNTLCTCIMDNWTRITLKIACAPNITIGCLALKARQQGYSIF